MSDEEDKFPGKWSWWYVKNGTWTKADMDWLTGSVEKMVNEYGGCARPMICDAGLYVFSLTARYITAAVSEQFSAYQKMSAEDQLTEDESWEDDSDILWLYFFEPVYPSTHVIFAYFDEIEAHTIFCATLKDTLEVTRLIKAAR